MARKSSGWDIPEGAEVVGADGGKIGHVVAVEEGHLVVEEGRLFPTDHIIPNRAVATVADGRVHLQVTKEVVRERSWDTALPSVEKDMSATREVTVLGSVPVTEDGEEILRVPVYEEELVPTTEERQIGEVLLNKSVVVEDRVVEVPVVEERIRITRHPVQGEAVLDEDVFTEGTIAIPIRGEEVGLVRQTRVVEEVEVGKEAVQITEQVAGTVRREQVHVDTAEFAASPMSDTPVGAGTDASLSAPGGASEPAASSLGTNEGRSISGSKRSAKRNRRKKR